MTELIPVYADTETCSECDLKKHGTHRYAEHPTTRIQLFSYAIGDGPVKLWSLEDGEPMPSDLHQAFDDPRYIFWFHNAWFDRNLIEQCLDIHLPIRRYRCAMALALSHALPASLEKLGEVLGLPQNIQKIKDGKRLVLKFCKPRKMKDGSLKWSTPATDPEDWKRYKEYCIVDTEAMRECIKRTPRWNYKGVELDYWYMDQKTNSRGMLIDVEFVHRAMDVIALNQKRLAKRTQEITDNQVQAASQRDAMLKFLLDQHGFELPDMQKATLEKVLKEGTLPPEVAELLELRLDTCTTSTAKYRKLAAIASTDGRVRGTIQFAGASRTLRDAGRGSQPQNAPRPTLSHDTIVEGIELVKNIEVEDAINALEVVGVPPMELCSSSVRYTIVAPDGKKFIVADLSNIEGRVLAYLAGEEWKLKAFAEYDAGNGPDLYIASYAKSFGIPIDKVTKADRAVGKVLELSMGFRGSVGAFKSFAVIYGVNLEELADRVRPTLDPAMLNKAREFYDWLYQQPGIKGAEPCYGLDKETFAALDCLKRLWRLGHPAVVQLWDDTENAVRNAVATAGAKFYFGNGMYAVRNKSWTKIVLPSGHAICYPMLEVDSKGKLRYKGVDQFTKKWQWIYTFSGKLVENCFAEDTKILTDRGIIPIVEVTRNDKVWDGISWVSTDGCIYQGTKEVGEWLKVRVTNTHKILVGNEWKSVHRLGIEDTLCALESAQDSINSLYLNRECGYPGVLNVFAIAARNIQSLMKLLMTRSEQSNALDAHSNLEARLRSCTGTYSQTRSTILGGIDTPECFGDVITPNAQSIKTMAEEGLRSTGSGEQINASSLSMLLSSKIGMILQRIWTALTIMLGTFRETYGSFHESLMPAIEGIIRFWSIKGFGIFKRNSTGSISRTGKASMRSHITWGAVDHSTGLWQSTTKVEKVYDLLNCGPNNRFTVVTEYGPVIVHNCVQSFARDIFKHGQLLAENNGYEVVMPVHDELVTEVPDTADYSVEGLEHYMATVPSWAQGIPLAAEGFEDYRYHK